MAILRGEDPETVDNYGTNPNSGEHLSLSADPTIERPARHVSIESGVPLPPAREEPEEPAPEKPEKPSDSDTKE